MNKFSLLLVFFNIYIVFAQYPKNIFGNPMQLPFILSGNFGELRSGHFHSGLDIKTPKQGYEVYALLDGVVSRIKVSSGGYGKALYITYPNGYTSVYAHLQRFSPKIEAYVREQQYQKESFEIELFPKEEQLFVKKGEIVAFSGNTGASSGAHLHFEIRDTKTQRTINPEHFGYQVKDKITPYIQELYVFALTDSTTIEGQNSMKKINFHNQGRNELKSDVIFANGKIGLGIRVIDKKDLAPNFCGIYKATLYKENIALFSYTFDELDFSENHYINTFIDYQTYRKNNARIQRLYKTIGNQLSIYSSNSTDGIISVEDKDSYNYFVEVEDFNKNKVRLEIPIRGEKKIKITDTEKNIGLPFLSQRENSYKTSKSTVFFAENTFYENGTIEVKQQGEILKIGPVFQPISKSYLIKIHEEKFTEKEKSQVFIARIQADKYIYHKTYNKANEFSAKPSLLGDFILVKDSIAPSITPFNFSSFENLKNKKTLQIKIEDDLSGIDFYRAQINGKWILMEYEPKEKMLTFDMTDLEKSQSEILLQIEVKDKVGNSQKKEYKLIYK